MCIRDSPRIFLLLWPRRISSPLLELLRWLCLSNYMSLLPSLFTIYHSHGSDQASYIPHLSVYWSPQPAITAGCLLAFHSAEAVLNLLVINPDNPIILFAKTSSRNQTRLLFFSKLSTLAIHEETKRFRSTILRCIRGGDWIRVGTGDLDIEIYDA